MQKHPSIPGLHHITAVSGPPQENFDFYRNILGLRFIKKTINFDDPFTYHLYYGNYNAEPGSAITFFPWQHVSKGKAGSGEATIVKYAVPGGSLGYWQERLAKRNVTIETPARHFGRPRILLEDTDGMAIEMVEDKAAGSMKTTGFGGVKNDYAIRGFFGTTLSLKDTGRTAELLEEFGWTQIGEEAGDIRFSATPDVPLGRFVDLRTSAGPAGKFGSGSVHHVAFRVADDEAQAAWREALLGMGFDVTPVQNRDYFRSIYFREPGGVLFEIATDIPGFDVDEPFDELGSNLKLPAWYEKHRDEIEKRLPELNVD